MATQSFYVVSWNGHTLNDTTYDTDLVGGEWGLPPVSVEMAARMDAPPLVADVQQDAYPIRLRISIDSAKTHAQNQTAREELAGWFNPRDKAVKALVIRDGDGAGGDGAANERSVNAICSEFVPMSNEVPNGFWVTLLVDDDTFWRATTATTHTWAITASGDTVSVTNPGDLDVDPTYRIKPTTAKSSGGYTNKRFITVRWRCTQAAQSYPVDIVNNGFDTATIVLAGDMQADGDDLRVEVDGKEVNRWLQDINDATTQVWVNLDFKAKWESTISAAIGSGDTVTSITVAAATTKAPSFGLLVVNSEIFVYTAKNDKTKTFTISQRAARGSTAGDHAAADAIWWCQHEIYMKWDDAAAAAPSTDDNYKPCFSLASTNTSWDFDEFGEDDGLRTASWRKAAVYRSPEFYTANRGTNADPWTEIGIDPSGKTTGKWWIYNPCGITVANFQNGEKNSGDITNWSASVKSSKDGVSWSVESAITAPSIDDTWESWSANETLITGSKAVGIRLDTYEQSGYKSYLECADVTLTLDSNYTPVCTMVGAAAVAGYDLSCTLANSTTGESMDVAFLMALDQEIEIDTDARTVTYLLDNSNQFQAVDHDKIRRLHWLKLQPGANTLAFTDVGTVALTVTVTYKARYY